MATFTVTRTIGAPLAAVWETLADIGTIADWNPGVTDSHVTGGVSGGEGAARHCDLGGRNYLDEVVVGWQPERMLTMRIVETNLPFDSADIRFDLVSDGAGSVVSVSPTYELRYGIIGRLLDAVFVRRTYRRGMGELLDGLAAHVEQLQPER